MNDFRRVCTFMGCFGLTLLLLDLAFNMPRDNSRGVVFAGFAAIFVGFGILFGGSASGEVK